MLKMPVSCPTLRAFIPALFGLLLLALCAAAQAQVAPLHPDRAFRFSARAVDAQSVEVRFAIAPGYYLYRDRFQFSAEGARLGAPQYPAGEMHEDEFFGKQIVFRDTLRVRLPVEAPVGQRFTLKVIAQGCADVGVCYPPTPYEANLVLAAMSSGQAGADPFAVNRSTPMMDTPGEATGYANGVEDEGSRAATLLREGRLVWIIAGFFGFGLLLAFTPCMLPMIPILSSLIVGQGEGLSRGRAFALSLAYVLGMAVTYALAGVAAAASGLLLAVWLQNVWVLGAFALLFVLLALAMFDVYTLQMPASWQARLASLTLGRGAVPGVMLMGALSALIVGPCVAAPLAGALLFIAQSGDKLVGGLALFTMALGMGAPLLAASLAAHHLLPRAGAWMEDVKRFFGLLLLATALWLVGPVLPALAVMLGWAALLGLAGVLFKGLDPLPQEPKMGDRIRQALGLLCLLVAGLMVVGAMAGSRDPLRPLDGLLGQAQTRHGPAFERVRSIAELDARLASADKPVMLDFYADWCVSCKEMERYTFTDAAVAERLSRFTLLQADVTANNADDRALLARFGLFGPPGIIFFDPRGREQQGLRVIGFQRASRFVQVLDAALARSGAQ